jgi:hypothetical protein
MANAYASTVFDVPAADVWARIRDFGDYGLWIDDVDDATIESDRAGDAVGAVRRVQIGARRIRQRLLALSDLDRSFSYEFCDPDPSVPPGYTATLRVLPVTDGDRSFIEWQATFDEAPGEAEHRAEELEQSFAGWLDSLRNHLHDR